MQVTVGLLRKAMEESGKDVILIDGFPRSADNREAFERVVSAGAGAGGGARTWPGMMGCRCWVPARGSPWRGTGAGAGC